MSMNSSSCGMAKREFSSHTVNYTLSGQRLDVQLRGTLLPGHEERWDRVLVAIEDVTERETARRALAASENFAHGLFQHSPISLWVEDFSRIKLLLDGLRSAASAICGCSWTSIPISSNAASARSG